jgi:hypothetical protein
MAGGNLVGSQFGLSARENGINATADKQAYIIRKGIEDEGWSI